MRRSGRIATTLVAGLGVLALFCLIVGGCVVHGYNRAIALSEAVGERWSQVDVVLQRRYDLIPNLVETVKGYAQHERDTLEAVIQARTRAVNAQGVEARAQAEAGLTRALGRLMLVVERYPELKANTNFLDLQKQLEGTENRIAVERRRYNQAVKELNTFCRSFFGRFYARVAGVEPAEYFEAAEAAAEAPRVDFGTGKTP